MLFIPGFWCICAVFFHTLTNSGEIMTSVDNLLIRALALNTVGVYGLFLVSSNCLVLLILFYWFHFSIVCPKGREGQTAVMKYEWDASLTFGLLSTWKHLIYVISKKILEALQGAEAREEGQFTLWFLNAFPSTLVWFLLWYSRILH